MAFLTIAPPPNETLEQRQRRIDDDIGPPHMDAGPGYPQLLEQTGFRSVVVRDVTVEYTETLAGWIRVRDEAWNELIRVIDESELVERQTRQRRTLNAVHDGLVSRLLVTGAVE